MATEKRFDRIEAHYTDSVQDVGTVRRVYYHALYLFGNYDTVTGDRVGDVWEWHYFGTTSAQKPPEYHGEAPVIQNAYISFPVDFELLGDEADYWYYEMAKQAGLRKEGLK